MQFAVSYTQMRATIRIREFIGLSTDKIENHSFVKLLEY